MNQESPERSNWLPLVLVVSAFLLLAVLVRFKLQPTGEPVEPAEVARSVTATLMDWRVLGTVHYAHPDYNKLKESIGRRVTGINGFSEGPGDGADWYEVELSPDLAAELRAALPQSSIVKKSRYFPQRDNAPAWWPKTWPADARCYELDLSFLVLPDTGTRAWLLRIRT